MQQSRSLGISGTQHRAVAALAIQYSAFERQSRAVRNPLRQCSNTRCRVERQHIRSRYLDESGRLFLFQQRSRPLCCASVSHMTGIRISHLWALVAGAGLRLSLRLRALVSKVSKSASPQPRPTSVSSSSDSVTTPALMRLEHGGTIIPMSHVREGLDEARHSQSSSPISCQRETIPMSQMRQIFQLA